MKNMTKSLIISLPFWMPAMAMAHTGGHVSGFWSGVIHPFSGLDHLLAMLAVGIWASQGGGRRQWMLPLTFILMMLAGGFAGLSGWSFPYVEVTIAASLLVLGLLVSRASRLNMFVSLAITGIFALFHGYGHGLEMPVGVNALPYSAGFALATAALLALGMGIGRYYTQPLVRIAGLGLMLSGAIFALV